MTSVQRCAECSLVLYSCKHTLPSGEKAVKTVKIFVFHSSNSQRVFSEPRPAWCFPFDLVDGWPSCLLFSVTQSWLRHQTRRVYSRHIQHVELEHHKDLRMTCVQVVIGFRQRQRLFHRFEAARNVENRQPLLYTKFPKGTEGYCSAHLHCVRMQSLDHRFAATQHDVHRLQWMCTSCQLVERGVRLVRLHSTLSFVQETAWPSLRRKSVCSRFAATAIYRIPAGSLGIWRLPRDPTALPSLLMRTVWKCSSSDCNISTSTSLLKWSKIRSSPCCSPFWLRFAVHLSNGGQAPSTFRLSWNMDAGSLWHSPFSSLVYVWDGGILVGVWWYSRIQHSMVLAGLPILTQCMNTPPYKCLGLRWSSFSRNLEQCKVLCSGTRTTRSDVLSLHQL